MSVTENLEGKGQAQEGQLTPPTGPEQSPPGGKVSSEQSPTHTKEQVDMAVHAALSAAGRAAGDFEKREQAVKAREDADAQREKAKYEADLEAASDDVEKTALIKARQIASTAVTRAERAEQELRDLREKGKLSDAEVAKTKLEVDTWEVAKRLDVDPEALLKTAKLTDGSKEAIETIASTLPKKGEAKAPLLTVSGGKTRGGLGDLSPKERMAELNKRILDKT